MIRGFFKAILKLTKLILEVIFTLILIGICVFVDARYIEPKLLVVKEQKIVTKKLTQEEPLRVVQFSDVHLRNDDTLETFKRVINKINDLNADIIIFTGDLIDDNKSFTQEEVATQLLKELKATYGKFAVYGNHDHGGNGTKRYARMMAGADFTLLVNEQQTLDLGNGNKITLTGVDDIVLGHPDFTAAFQNTDPSAYQLFLSHAPDVVDKVQTQNIDLQLSGHSHGGQVRVPFIGAPFTAPYGRQYIKGLYEVAEKNDMLLYVNSGIGTSQLPYRFMNPPEITLFLISN